MIRKFLTVFSGVATAFAAQNSHGSSSSFIYPQRQFTIPNISNIANFEGQMLVKSIQGDELEFVLTKSSLNGLIMATHRSHRSHSSHRSHYSSSR